MHFLIVDDRFGTPISVLLEVDPRNEPGFPGLPVREVILERHTEAGGMGPSGNSGGECAAVGRDPSRLDLFREFWSDKAVGAAGFILVEPRYVGPSWAAYLTAFRPEGQKPFKRPRHAVTAARPAAVASAPRLARPTAGK